MSGAISQDQFGRHFVDGGSQRYLFTVITKMPGSKRGEYCEEIDVFAGSVGEAKRIGNIILKADYIPELYITKLIRVW